MSSNAYAAPLRLELRPSRQRRQWRWLTHLAGAASLLLLQSHWLAIAVFVVVLASWRRSRHEPAITLLWRSDGGWTLFEDGHELEAVLVGTPFVQPWLVILPLRVDGRRCARRIAVFPDSLPRDGFRRLRVRLRG